MTQQEILHAARLIEAQRNGEKATWAVWQPGEDPRDADVTRQLTGLPRYFERTNQATGQTAASADFRDQYVRITTSFEHWLLVGDVLTAMAAGLFVFFGER
jgi:hypothetical protein